MKNIDDIEAEAERVFASFTSQGAGESKNGHSRKSGSAFAPSGPHGKSDAGAELMIECASDVRPEPVTWLWTGRLARGKQTLIAGDPGTGKSQFSVYVTAMITTGAGWPCGEGLAPKGSVIILSAEDGTADTIVPRLMAAGADRSKVYIVRAVRMEEGKGRRSFNLQADLELLRARIDQIGDVVLIVVDPVSSYLGRKIDGHSNTDIRGVLEPFGDMAEQKKVGVLAITHFNKGGASSSGKALHRFIGSIAFVAAARIAFVVVEDQGDPDRKLFLHAKNNLAAPPQGLAYRLEQRLAGDTGIVASNLFWESEPVTLRADQALAAGRGAQGSHEATATDDCASFLEAVLADGPIAVVEIEKEARSACLLGDGQSISQPKPFRSARERLGIKPYHPRGQKAGGWVWAQPGQMPPKASDALTKERASDEEEGI
jgi:putative DNA primase/helicase